MKGNEILALLDEPACEHNHKQKPAVARPNPGQPRAAAPLMAHRSPCCRCPMWRIWCTARSAVPAASRDNRGSLSSGPRINRLGFTTDLNEQDVIMGRGERRLFHAVRHIVNRYHPAAVFVYNTCVPAMEGDDIDAVCR